MRHPRTRLIVALLLATGATRAGADVARPTPPPAAKLAPVQAVPAVPQQTTASFGDWTLRCTRISPTTQSCEVAQGISSQDRTVAQIAFGRVARGQALQLTILVPSSVTFGAAPALSPLRDGEAPVVELTWRRCLPGGCMADAPMSDDALRRVRGWAEPARITFTDGAGRAIALPFSPRGLPQALDAMAKDDAG